MRAVHRTADKVCSCSEEKRIFSKLGSIIMSEEDEGIVRVIFATMAGELSLQDLPTHLKEQLPSTLVDTTKWKQASSWMQWWMRPVHLSKQKDYFLLII